MTMATMSFDKILLCFAVVIVAMSRPCCSHRHLSALGQRSNEIFKETSDEAPKLKFPVDFTFAGATASYQIEGAWDVDGRGPSIWDTFTHSNPEKIADRSNGDVAARSYDLFEEDLKALKEIGVDFYRFSISWPRILPTGERESRNQKGIDYYNRLIDTMLANKIRPMMTIFHWDLPQALQDKGGFLSPLIVDYFKIYAEVIFEEFSDRVMVFTTFNEPLVFCQEGYEDGIKPPAIKAIGVGLYLCTHHLLLSHAVTYRLYEEKYAPLFEHPGLIGINVDSGYFYRKDANDANDIENRALHFHLGLFLNPIFSKEGGYPDIMVRDIARNSAAEGRAWSRLPEFTETQRNFVKGSADFLGFNYYTSKLVASNPIFNVSDPPSWSKDTRLVFSVDAENWPRAKSSWLYSVPRGLRDVLAWIKATYNDPMIYIQENGWSDDGEIMDIGRIEYYRLHLLELLKSLHLDGVRVKGFTFWSLIDNFEWLQGYTEKFGLYYVNFTSPQRERIAKESSRYMKKVIRTMEVEDFVPPLCDFDGDE